MQARTVEDIAKALVVHARDYSTSVDPSEITDARRERLLRAQTELRLLAATLRASAQTLQWYSFFESLRLVLPRDAVIQASRELIGLSNCVPPGREDIPLGIKCEKEIKRLLGIDSTEGKLKGDTGKAA